jgi:DNA excision repair protein ERCC-4
MDTKNYPISIVADYREVPSKVPEILKELGAKVKFSQLKTGDYLLNNEIIVERKSREDFILSLIQGRLFSQCSRLKNTTYHQILLIEGNPYKTAHNIDRQAIKGALLSVSMSWQIPIIYSSDISDTAQMLIMATKQLLNEKLAFRRCGYKPKTFRKKAIYFLQGLPSVGPKLAIALLDRFGSLENVILATTDELLETNGLGKEKVKKIREFLGWQYKKSEK